MYVNAKALVDGIFHSIDSNSTTINNDLYFGANNQFINRKATLDFDSTIYSFILGKNFEITPNFMVGVAVGYGRSNTEDVEIKYKLNIEKHYSKCEERVYNEHTKSYEYVELWESDNKTFSSDLYMQNIKSNNFIFSAYSLYDRNNIHGGIKLLYNLNNYDSGEYISKDQWFGMDGFDVNKFDAKQSSHTFSAEFNIGHDWLVNDSLKLVSTMYLKEMYVLLPGNTIEHNSDNIKIKPNGSNSVSISPEFRLLFKNKNLFEGKLMANLYVRYNLMLTQVRMNSNFDQIADIKTKYLTKKHEIIGKNRVVRRMNTKLEQNNFEFGLNAKLLVLKDIIFSLDYRMMALFGRHKEATYHLGFGITINL
ncbi:hypothetical protein FACS1894152_3540 [Bacilli bacterium]|nr:hypothetical protein FACS1894152_3540 [Bacilli bacterium]